MRADDKDVKSSESARCYGRNGGGSPSGAGGASGGAGAGAGGGGGHASENKEDTNQRDAQGTAADKNKLTEGFAVFVSGFTFSSVGSTCAERREAFRTAFSSYGEVIKVVVRGARTPFAFVTFADEESQGRAIAAGTVAVGSGAEECEVSAKQVKCG